MSNEIADRVVLLESKTVELFAMLDRLKGSTAEMIADARRYRFLKNHGFSFSLNWHNGPSTLDSATDSMWRLGCDYSFDGDGCRRPVGEIDDVIDKAIKFESEKGGT